MGDKERKKQYDLEYAKKHLKRIPLDVKLDKYEEIKLHAEQHGESINGYIKKAVDERMERDSTGATIKAAARTSEPSSGIISPNVLKTAQKAVELTREPLTQFVERAVQTQSERDKLSLQMGINPATGKSLTKESTEDDQ